MNKVPQPVTFQDRVAFALCAHDNSGIEGRLSEQELAELDDLMTFARGALGHAAAHQRFRSLVNFVRMERAYRSTDGKTVMLVHIIHNDWPNYLGAAGAAIAVMMERPEAAAAITTSPEG